MPVATVLRRRTARAWLGRGLAAVLLSSGVVSALPQPSPPTNPLFTFHSNPWLNLHHFIRAHARGQPITGGLSEDEQRIWTAGVEFYKRYASRDVLNDDGMVAIKNALRDADGRPTLAGAAIDDELRSTLERVLPIYRTHWWPAHDRANREWIAAVQPLVERHGPRLAAAIAGAYDTRWPMQPIHVDLSVIAGPVGAYTSVDPTHVMISSRDPGYRGHAALEMLFHESSHGVSGLYPAVARAAEARGVKVPPGLWHGVLFYTAGELTRRELAAAGIQYTEYASAEIYRNLCGEGCRGKIVERWSPRLDAGGPGLAEALGGLVASFQ